MSGYYGAKFLCQTMEEQYELPFHKKNHIICHICRTMVCSFATMAMRSNDFSSLLVGKVAQKTLVPGTQLLAFTETSVLAETKYCEKTGHYTLW